MVALWNERLCMNCLVARTGVPTARAAEILTVLGRVLAVQWSIATCERCSAAKAMVTLI